MPHPVPTEAQIVDALRSVQEPELWRDIVDLDMVRSVQIDTTKDGSMATVAIALKVDQRLL